MGMENPIQIEILETDGGVSPFEKWYDSIRDKTTRARILTRLDRLRSGNFGDCKSVGEGILDLRCYFGSGYRIYYGRVGELVVVLLGRGGKSTQNEDINKAISLWRKYKNEAQRYRRKFP